MKQFYKFFIFPLCIMLFASFAYSKEYPKGVKLIKNGNSYTVQFSLPEYKTSNVRGGNENFTSLEIPDYGITSQVGLPLLPQISFFLLINKNEVSPLIKVIGQDKKLIDLKSPIYPVQMPWEKTKSLDDRPFVIDRAYYNSKGSVDGPFVIISEPFIMSGAKGVMVTIYPFAYNPSKNELFATLSGSFNIELQNSAVLNFSPRPAMDEFFASTFINYDFKDSKGTNNYLILTAPEYESGLAPFVTHKQGLGYNVTVVNTGVTGTTNTAIKTYIQNLYNNISTRPEFILMVGDIDKIPEWIGTGEGTPHTDWNYGLLEGNDMYVDAFVGRFPITNLTQLSNMITKTIYMENGVNSLWKKNVFMASTDNYAISEGTHNFVIDSFFVPAGFINTKLYSHNGATTSQVSQSIDSGKIFAIYSGHGSETSWADGPVFSQANVNALNNTIFPFVYSFACITGSYHIAGECFAETWVRSPKGAATFWGSSVNSYWNEDDILERRIERALFTENLKRNAENFVRGKVLLIQYYGSITATMQRYIEMYNCMGDPSIYQRAYGPAIAHIPLPNTENVTGPYTVNCVVTPSGSAITGTKLFWTRTSAFDSLTMTNTSGNNWTANIPGNGAAASYKYYLRTQDALNRVTYLPGGAPANYFSFNASPDISNPVITHTPIGPTPKFYWPIAVTATVTDNIGIDSVWVKWRINSGVTKQFKILNTSGSTYSALFNSVNTDVFPNDIIYYKIYAQDNSSNHNRDSSTQYNFIINNLTSVCIGNGTIQMGSSSGPFNTYWYGNRTNILWTSAEILANGGIVGDLITRVGFSIATVGGQAMTGLTYRFQNTALTTLTGFTSTGWETAYTGNYNVPGTGMQYIDLQTPFYWNGTNLLMEICFQNTSYTTATVVNGTTISGMEYTEYHDLSTACSYTGFTAPTAQTARANVCFYFSNFTGINTSNGNIPTKYNLSQNYPNPFNPVTKINFALPKQGFVTLKIYDVLGREIRTLVNEVKTAGNFSVDFNASEYSSGVYFYRLESEGFTDIKRMMLIK